MKSLDQVSADFHAQDFQFTPRKTPASIHVGITCREEMNCAFSRQGGVVGLADGILVDCSFGVQSRWR